MPSPSKTRVERDGRGPRTTYDDIEVGADLGVMTWRIERSNVQGLLRNDDDFHEWYEGPSPFGDAVAPPTATYPPVRILFTRRYNVRGLFVQFDSEFLAPIFYGQSLVITGRISAKYIKRDREYVSYYAEGRTEAGDLVFTTTRTHVLDYLPRTVERAGDGLDSGMALGKQD